MRTNARTESIIEALNATGTVHAEVIGTGGNCWAIWAELVSNRRSACYITDGDADIPGSFAEFGLTADGGCFEMVTITFPEEDDALMFDSSQGADFIAEMVAAILNRKA